MFVTVDNSFQTIINIYLLLKTAADGISAAVKTPFEMLLSASGDGDRYHAYPREGEGGSRCLDRGCSPRPFHQQHVHFTAAGRRPNAIDASYITRSPSSSEIKASLAAFVVKTRF